MGKHANVGHVVGVMGGKGQPGDLSESRKAEGVCVEKKVLSDAADTAIQHICEREEELGALIKEQSVVRSVQQMLKAGGFDLVALHNSGDLRDIINVFI
jgi:hypothetical protein